MNRLFTEIKIKVVNKFREINRMLYKIKEILIKPTMKIISLLLVRLAEIKVIDDTQIGNRIGQ